MSGRHSQIEVRPSRRATTHLPRLAHRPAGLVRSHLTTMGCSRTRSSSASAWSGSPTLMVRIPRARAGLRLTPRSSRNTDSSGSTPSVAQASSMPSSNHVPKNTFPAEILPTSLDTNRSGDRVVAQDSATGIELRPRGAGGFTTRRLRRRGDDPTPNHPIAVGMALRGIERRLLGSRRGARPPNSPTTLPYPALHPIW